MKKIVSGVLAASMALSLAACGGSSSTASTAATAAPAESAASTETAAPAESADAAVTLVMAEVNPLDTIVGMTDTFFKEKVEELSNGTITVDLQASGVLGSENDVLDNILAGGDTIDMSRISAFALSTYGCSKATLLSLPFTFVSRDHFWSFANSDLASEFLSEPQDVGLPIRGVFYAEEGFRHFFTKNEIKSTDDLAGMKLRVSNDPVMTGLVKDLGAAPTVVSFSELYSSLQTGVVDGAEQPIANYKSNAFNEVAPYLILDGHTLGAVQVVITDNAWNKLSEAQQNAIMEAGKLAQAYNQDLSQSKEDEVLEELAGLGVTVVEVSDEEKAALQQKVSDVVSANVGSNQDLYDQILAMA